MRTGVLVLAVAIGATACGSRRPAGHKDAGAGGVADDDGGVLGPPTHVLPPISPSRALPQPDVPNPSQLKFVLLEPGAAPRAARRYRAGAPARELVASASIISKGYLDGTWSDELALPPVRDGFGVQTEARPGALVVHLRGLVAEVDEEGATKPGLDAAAGYLTRWRLLLERRRADVTIDDRGQLGTLTMLDDPAGRGGREARDELVQRWIGLAVPLPAEPVGAGARWRVVTLVRTGGATVKQTATYQLVEARADGWTIGVELERIGEHQDITVPGMPPDTLAELIAMRRTVTGTLTVGADDPLPRAGELAVESASHARFAVPGMPASEQVTEDRAKVTFVSR